MSFLVNTRPVVVKSFLLTLVFLASGLPKLITGQAREESLQLQEALYNGDSIKDMLTLCRNFELDDLETFPEEMYRLCPSGERCMKTCNEPRLLRLRDAQTRVENMITQLEDFQRIFWPLVVFFIVFLQGMYLIFVKQFNWRTLPFVPGYEFELDPTDGYRYRHYMWMRWVILDSEHPKYYQGMTADTQELEYKPQIETWEDPHADSEEEIHHAWSVRDICDMTADPHERLEIYFRRVQQNYQLNKLPPGHARKHKKKKKR